MTSIDPECFADDRARVAAAAGILARGGVVAIPTETVYGLGADAANADAVRRVFAIKGRPADHPVIVHVGGAEDIPRWARDVPAQAEMLARRYWPGPLTLVLPRAADVADVVTGGQDTVALRAPAHPLTQALLRAFGGGIAAPSANRHGCVSPTTAAHVREDLGDAVDMILDGGPCAVGLESTILALVGAEPVLLRPGAISPEELGAVLGRPVALPGATTRIRAPGALAAHYAPRAPLDLCAPQALPARVAELQAAGAHVGCLIMDGAPALPAGVVQVTLPASAAGYGTGLYAALRRLDAAAVDRILVAQPPQNAAWRAVNDRLRRAARGSASA